MRLLQVRNGDAFPLAAVPRYDPRHAIAAARAERGAGARLAAMFGAAGEGDAVRVHLVLARDTDATLSLCAFDVPRAAGGWPALTLDWTQAHVFEREIAEQFGVEPFAHPALQPVRGEPPHQGRDLFPPPPNAASRLDAHRFLQADGDEMHEVGVGPVHAGIIEPGHFHFLCHGEQVWHLEIALGYQHRGVEQALRGGPDARTLALVESIAGDSVIGHAAAHCAAVEGLAGLRVGARALAIRAVALELERCSNHVGDLGALANDVGFLPAAAWLGALRGEFLNLLMDLSGNRYGRGLLRPGGVRFDLDAAMARDFVARLRRASDEFARLAELLFRKPSVMARFDGVGVVPRDTAEALGMVGPAARASGCSRDVRHDFAHGAYRFQHIPMALATAGDVAARALLRRLETERSLEFLLERLQNLPAGSIARGPHPRLSLPPQTGCVALTEGWRGEIAHVVLTDAAGAFARYKVVDPSFHNWPGLAMAMRNEEISDFPLCNKSFNLSYAGHDL